MHRLNSLLVLALFAFSGCASTKFTAEKNSPKSVILAPDVSAEMLDSSFWIHKIKNPDEVKMTADEIYIWNNLNTNNPGLFLVDLKKYDSVISGEEIRGEIVHYTPKRKWYKKVTTKESEKIIELKESDWKSLFKKMNISPLGTFEDFTANKKASQNKKDFPVRRGICVARSNLRMIPDDDFYSDDKDFWFDDAAQNSGILMNEPVVVLWESLDKNFLLVRTAYCSGWIHREDVAFCDDEQFFECFDWTKKKAEGFITVTADRFLLPDEYVVGFNASDSLKSTLPEFFMGTRLLCASWNQDGIVENFSPRVPHGCFLVKVPFRKSDETLGFEYAAIPSGRAHQGLVDYTSGNVLQLAFQSLGIRYGWGGMANARDCSEYLKDIFRCFGFDFPRNSRSQMEMAGKTVSFAGKSSSKRRSLMKNMEPGTVLGFPGHVFMYVGEEKGKNYVISALGSYYPDEFYTEKMDACSVNINTLDVMRKNGKNWLDNMTHAKLLKIKGNQKTNEVEFDSSWKFAEFSKINTGKSFLYKAGSKRKNIVVAVNAGHGTKGGTEVQTYSHPDKSPKLTSGTTVAGSIESCSISEGMTFNDKKTEAVVNLRTARILKKLLLDAGYDVLMVRDEDDVQLDNIARTLICNNFADIHISIHYDKDSASSDKGVFYCSIPEELKKLKNVRKHSQKSERLGQCLVEGLKKQKLAAYNDGKIEMDLPQTSFSTIPTVDVELGNQWTVTSTAELEKRAQGLLKGIELFFAEKK